MKVTILKDSRHHYEGNRLTTFELTYPRFIHAEFMTHRMFSRNSSSSRAIPVAKMIRDVKENPVIPIHWGMNQKGMVANGELSADQKEEAKGNWLMARDEALRFADNLREIGLHKQIANRILEPWMWITVIVTATEFSNFFKLRAHHAAEPHIQALAYEMMAAYETSVPTTLYPGMWHLPFIDDDPNVPQDIDTQIKVSVARCARGSYLQQHGDHTVEGDCDLHDRLAAMGHWSPFEHQAMVGYSDLHSNFANGWTQYRKTFKGEAGL